MDEINKNDSVNPLPIQWQGTILPFNEQREKDKIVADYQDELSEQARYNMENENKPNEYKCCFDVDAPEQQTLISKLLEDLHALLFSIEENTEHLARQLSPIMKNCPASVSKEASPVLNDDDSDLAKELNTFSYGLQKHLNVLIELRENCQL